MGRRATTTNYHDVCCKWCRKYLCRKANSRRDDKRAVVRYERRVEAKADIREQLDDLRFRVNPDDSTDERHGPQWVWDIIHSV